MAPQPIPADQLAAIVEAVQKALRPSLLKDMRDAIRADREQEQQELRQQLPPPLPPQQQILITPWRIEEFGLFEPDLPIDDRHPPGDVVTVGRDTIYRNVDAFIERIKDAIRTKTPATVRDNLHLCLRGQAWQSEPSRLGSV
jgi:hypothetical protein